MSYTAIQTLERKVDTASSLVEKLRALAELSTAYYDDYHHYDASDWLVEAVEEIERLRRVLAAISCNELGWPEMLDEVMP